MRKLNIYNLQIIKENSIAYDVQQKIRTPEDAVNVFKNAIKLDMKSEEYLYMLALNTKNCVIGCCEISHGSINNSIVHPREIFKRALLLNATSIIIAHNHPSGNSEPSKEDINVTERIKQCGELMGIELLDHVIIGDNYYSFKANDLI